MTQLLTTSQIGQLLSIDRTTVYRMAESGRLPAVRVGKQWRFSENEIRQWLRTQHGEPVVSASAVTMPLTDSSVNAPANALPLACVQDTQDLVAGLLGATLVVVDLQGHMVTQPSTLGALHADVLRRSQGQVDCLPSPAAFGSVPLDGTAIGPLGLRWARGFIRLDDNLIGLVLAGGFVEDGGTVDDVQLQSIAARIGAPLDALRALSGGVHCMNAAGCERIVQTAQRLADVFGHMAEERRTFCGKLQAIAALTVL